MHIMAWHIPSVVCLNPDLTPLRTSASSSTVPRRSCAEVENRIASSPGLKPEAILSVVPRALTRVHSNSNKTSSKFGIPSGRSALHVSSASPSPFTTKHHWDRRGGRICQRAGVWPRAAGALANLDLLVLLGQTKRTRKRKEGMINRSGQG
jgi:hypothetical protein